MTEALARILEARRARRPLAALGEAAPPDEAAGYALQYELAGALGAVPPPGFKVGATTAAMQAYLNLPGPCAGFVLPGALHEGRAEFRLADHVRPGVECEVGLRLGRDLAPGRHRRAALEGAVSEVFAALEVVDDRYEDFAALGAPSVIADAVFHAGGVVGAPAPGWPGLDLAAVRGRVWVDGTLRGEGEGAALLGHPLEALAWLAGSGAARAFGGLRAGQVVFLGSVTPPIWLDGPGEARVAFEGLGEVTARFT